MVRIRDTKYSQLPPMSLQRTKPATSLVPLCTSMFPLAVGISLGISLAVLFTTEITDTPWFPKPQNLAREQNKQDDLPVTKQQPQVGVKILCFIMAEPNNFDSEHMHGTRLWGNRCDKLLYFSHAPLLDEPSVIIFNTTEGREWMKLKLALTYVHDHYIDEYDWFIRTDDTSFVIIENLRYMLQPYSSNDPLYFGCKFKPFVKQGYMSENAGYVLSKEALKLFVMKALPNEHLCRKNPKSSSDIELGICLENVEVFAGDSRDELGRGRFFPFSPEHHLVPGHVDASFWYAQYNYYEMKSGLNCCADDAISFHGLSSIQMFTIDYLLYTVQLYGVASKPRPLQPRITIEELRYKKVIEEQLRENEIENKILEAATEELLTEKLELINSVDDDDNVTVEHFAVKPADGILQESSNLEFGEEQITNESELQTEATETLGDDLTTNPSENTNHTDLKETPEGDEKVDDEPELIISSALDITKESLPDESEQINSRNNVTVEHFAVKPADGILQESSTLEFGEEQITNESEPQMDATETLGGDFTTNTSENTNLTYLKENPDGDEKVDDEPQLIISSALDITKESLPDESEQINSVDDDDNVTVEHFAVKPADGILQESSTLEFGEEQITNESEPQMDATETLGGDFTTNTSENTNLTYLKENPEGDEKVDYEPQLIISSALDITKESLTDESEQKTILQVKKETSTDEFLIAQSEFSFSEPEKETSAVLES